MTSVHGAHGGLQNYRVGPPTEDFATSFDTDSSIASHAQYRLSILRLSVNEMKG